MMHALTDIVLEKHRNKLKQGAVMVAPGDMGTIPRMCFLLDHAIREGTDQTRVVSRRLQFIEIDPQGQACNAGWAPHLDLTPIDAADLDLVQDIVAGSWLNQGGAQTLEQVALAHASQHLVPDHFSEVKARREQQAELTLRAVHERLVKEINFWSDRYIKLQEDIAAGKDVRLTLENARRTIEELTARLESRKRELEASRHVISASPIVIGGVLVIPSGLLALRRGEQSTVSASHDDAARMRVERIAMEAVIRAEQALGHQVIDVSAEKCGWDVTSQPGAIDGRFPQPRHIEVKGRAKGQSTVTVTKNEVFAGFNQGDKFVLAVVFVDGDKHDGPFYIPCPFTQEPDWAVTSINLDLDELLSRAVPPHSLPVTH